MSSRRRLDLRNQLADGVRAQRKLKGWSQLDAALELGLHPRHLQRIERAEMNVTLQTIERFCSVFDCDITVLFNPPTATTAATSPRRKARGGDLRKRNASGNRRPARSRS